MVGGQDGEVERGSHEIACRKTLLKHMQAAKQPGPRQEVVGACQHVKVRQQQLHAGLRKEVGTRHLEMRNVSFSQRCCHVVGIAV